MSVTRGSIPTGLEYWRLKNGTHVFQNTRYPGRSGQAWPMGWINDIRTLTPHELYDHNEVRVCECILSHRARPGRGRPGESLAFSASGDYVFTYDWDCNCCLRDHS